MKKAGEGVSPVVQREDTMVYLKYHSLYCLIWAVEGVMLRCTTVSSLCITGDALSLALRILGPTVETVGVDERPLSTAPMRKSKRYWKCCTICRRDW